jgi:hypothetical protein
MRVHRISEKWYIKRMNSNILTFEELVELCEYYCTIIKMHPWSKEYFCQIKYIKCLLKLLFLCVCTEFCVELIMKLWNYPEIVQLKMCGILSSNYQNKWDYFYVYSIMGVIFWVMNLWYVVYLWFQFLLVSSRQKSKWSVYTYSVCENKWSLSCSDQPRYETYIWPNSHSGGWI